MTFTVLKSSSPSFVLRSRKKADSRLPRPWSCRCFRSSDIVVSAASFRSISTRLQQVSRAAFCASEAHAPRVALDGGLYRDLVIVLELELGRLGAGHGIVGEAGGGALEVDVVGGFVGGGRLGLRAAHARGGLGGLDGRRGGRRGCHCRVSSRAVLETSFKPPPLMGRHVMMIGLRQCFAASIAGNHIARADLSALPSKTQAKVRSKCMRVAPAGGTCTVRNIQCGIVGYPVCDQMRGNSSLAITPTVESYRQGSTRHSSWELRPGTPPGRMHSLVAGKQPPDSAGCHSCRSHS